MVQVATALARLCRPHRHQESAPDLRQRQADLGIFLIQANDLLGGRLQVDEIALQVVDDPSQPAGASCHATATTHNAAR